MKLNTILDSLKSRKFRYGGYATLIVIVVLAAAVVLLFVLKRDFYDGLIAKILTWFSLLKRYNDFSMGILGLSPIVYYVSFCGMFVFLTIRMIERRRWV